jgi:hypothetical protein
MPGKRNNIDQSDDGLIALRIMLLASDLATLTELAKKQYRTPQGQAGFLIHQLCEQSRNGRVQLAGPSSSTGSKPLEWETGK